MVRDSQFRLYLNVLIGILSLGLLPLSGLAATPATIVVSGSVQFDVSQGKTELLLQLPQNVSLRYLDQLATLYENYGMQPLWRDPQAVKQFQQQLAEVGLSGIQPQFTRWMQTLTDPNINGLARDIVLSDALLGYLYYVTGVEAHREAWLYSEKTTSFSMEVPPAADIKRWQSAIQNGSLTEFIQSLAPTHPQYRAMHQQLGDLLNDHRPWPRMMESGSLHPDGISADIPALREILQRTGMLPAEKRLPLVMGDVIDSHAVKPQSVNEDIRYTPELVEKVKQFQQWQGLMVDGIIGSRTREWLNISPSVRASLLALNIQRLRILPEDLTTGIMVNIPNYSLVYYQDGSEVLFSQVIVGSPNRKTPLMKSKLNKVVINPPWNVPTRLTREDILPKVIKNPRYLKQHGYTLLSSWNNDTQVVNPDNINWDEISVDRFPYRIRQAPGENNSLGYYKFDMPNAEAIYLHDTPNHRLFNRDIRALSAGCIRVNKAATLASLLLESAGWNDAQVSLVLKTGNTRYVPIPTPIPVYLYYLTAWVNEQGKAQYRTDIYQYDAAVYAGEKIVSLAERLFHL